MHPGYDFQCLAFEPDHFAQLHANEINATEKKAKFDILKARAQRVKAVSNDSKYAAAWDVYPFNSGYFMCIRMKTVDAETLRIHLLDRYGVGLISLENRTFVSLFRAWKKPMWKNCSIPSFKELKTWKKVSRRCRKGETKQSAYRRILKRMKSLNIAQATRWSFYFIAIGLIAGLGSIVFHYLCQLGLHYFLDVLAGYRPPAPAGEHHLLPPTSVSFNRLMLLFLPAMGGLLSGWLVYTFAPEAEGHGTDAAINCLPQQGWIIRSRVPIIKTIASAITLTTGGSGGREEPLPRSVPVSAPFWPRPSSFPP